MSFTGADQVVPPLVERENQMRVLQVDAALAPGSLASEVHPAPPAEQAKFTRAAKPRYASQEANRAALNQAIGNAMSQPAGASGGYSAGGGYSP